MLWRLANDLVGLALAAVSAAGVQLAAASFVEGAAGLGADEAFELLLLVATQSFLFALPLALPLILIAEANKVQSWHFYAWAGVLVGWAGWLVVMTASEGTAIAFTNGLAILTFAAAGLVGGTAFWLAAGRLAGPEPREQMARAEEDFAITRL